MNEERFEHKDHFDCISGKQYCLKHLHKRNFVFDDILENKQYECEIIYSNHVYTAGVKDLVLRANYDDHKLINIETLYDHREYRFFSHTRYNLAIDLNNLLDQCYRNEIRMIQQGKNKYTAFPYINKDNPNKYYLIILTFKKEFNLNKITINSAYIATDTNEINRLKSKRKIKLLTILRKLKN